MMDDIAAEKLILKDISKTPVLPIITKGPLAGCFLANSVNVQIPFPNLPKIVAEGWAWEGDPLLAKLNNIWIAVDAQWVLLRKKEQGISLTDAFYDIVNLCGLSAVGQKKGLQKSLLNVLKNKAFTLMENIHHDGGGFENGDHPPVLVVKRLGTSDRSLLSVIGDKTKNVSFILTEDPTAEIIDFPKK
jgi:hypothetical protein